MKTWLKPVLIGSGSNLRFIIEVPNISLPHLEAGSHLKAWSEKITFKIYRSPGFYLRKYGSLQSGIVECIQKDHCSCNFP